VIAGKLAFVHPHVYHPLYREIIDRAMRSLSIPAVDA